MRWGGVRATLKSRLRSKDPDSHIKSHGLTLFLLHQALCTQTAHIRTLLQRIRFDYSQSFHFSNRSDLSETNELSSVKAGSLLETRLDPCIPEPPSVFRFWCVDHIVIVNDFRSDWFWSGCCRCGRSRRRQQILSILVAH